MQEDADEMSEDDLRTLARAKRVMLRVAASQPSGSHRHHVAGDCAGAVDRLIKAVMPERFFEWQDFARETELD